MIKLLLVDDEPDILEVAKLSLGLTEAFEVVTCPSGEKAVEAVRTFNPDVLLLDYRLRDMLGTELLRILRRIDGLENVPAIFLTAQVDDASKSELQGADGVIDKPFDPLTLGDQVREMIREQCT